MTNIIVKDGIAVHATNDTITLPDTLNLIEFNEYTSGLPLRVGSGDINTGNCMLYNDVVMPEDYEGGKYLFDGTDWSLNPDYPGN